MGIAFAQIDSWLIAIAFDVLMIAGWLAGWWIGRRSRIREDKARAFRAHEANLALLALLIAFTFSMSYAKREQTRATVVSDSNAIGEFYTCAGLIKEPVRAGLRSAIRQYTELHIGMSGHWRDKADLEQMLSQIQQLQEKMVDFVAEAVDGGTLIAVPLTNTLNEVISMSSSRIAAIENRLHPAVVIVLFMAGLFTMMLVGREQGFEGKIEFVGSLGSMLLITLIVYLILAMNQPSRGLLAVSQEPLQRLLSAMGK